MFIKSRAEKIKKFLNFKLKGKLNSDDLNNIVEAFDIYEKDNLDTISKLKRKKANETKRISGALKQTINAHGPITKELIGSATKRIHGSLLLLNVDDFKTTIKHVMIGVSIASIVFLFIIFGFVI